MVNCCSGTGSATPGGFTIRQDTEVVPKRGDFEAREDTEVLRMGTGGGFDVREDTEVLRIGGLGVQAASGVGGNTTEGFEVRRFLVMHCSGQLDTFQGLQAHVSLCKLHELLGSVSFHAVLPTDSGGAVVCHGAS